MESYGDGLICMMRERERRAELHRAALPLPMKGEPERGARPQKMPAQWKPVGAIWLPV